MLELRKKYKSGSAAEIIRDAILSGEISGEISQNDFADSLGISRIPVREALISLEYQGLIERLSNQHVKIINLNEESIKNIFQDMSLLEIEVLKNLNDKKLQQLSLLKNQMDFHRELYKSVNSPLRMNFLKVITETYLSLRRLENEVIRLLNRGQIVMDVGNPIKVSINQFYGIEINDFAGSVAKTALWIADLQMQRRRNSCPLSSTVWKSIPNASPMAGFSSTSSSVFPCIFKGFRSMD